MIGWRGNKVSEKVFVLQKEVERLKKTADFWSDRIQTEGLKGSDWLDLLNSYHNALADVYLAGKKLKFVTAGKHRLGDNMGTRSTDGSLG